MQNPPIDQETPHDPVPYCFDKIMSDDKEECVTPDHCRMLEYCAAWPD